MEHNELQLFWGKTPKSGESPDRYHPAFHHMLDVACSAQELIVRGTPRLQASLEYAWKGANLPNLFSCLPLVVAIHDLGKISAAF